MSTLKISNIRKHQSLLFQKPLPSRIYDTVELVSWPVSSTYVSPYTIRHYGLTLRECLNPNTSGTVFTALWSYRMRPLIPGHEHALFDTITHRLVPNTDPRAPPVYEYSDAFPDPACQGTMVVKFAQTKWMPKLKKEAEFYDKMKRLQGPGGVVPTCIGLYRGQVDKTGEEFAVLLLEHAQRQPVMINDYRALKEKFGYDEVLHQLYRLHAAGIMHGDPFDQNNLLRDDRGQIRFVDFAQSWVHTCDPYHPVTFDLDGHITSPRCNELQLMDNPHLVGVGQDSYLWERACQTRKESRKREKVREWERITGYGRGTNYVPPSHPS
ncbi:hypothetical protein K435DRAFT_963552 [Dendrothele bispora CBS 962.96]|uniref:Protein kinase domain-containing protein n=1 Tax=Dendrothele bispora (strain CBS 962.96) TaxID=1314807 RepID=A0A4S8MG67_DENBC|nr:hypothetical protein K435DRAFT_963552 [Dendrothele bispora CBS 962.96]